MRPTFRKIGHDLPYHGFWGAEQKPDPRRPEPGTRACRRFQLSPYTRLDRSSGSTQVTVPSWVKHGPSADVNTFGMRGQSVYTARTQLDFAMVGEDGLQETALKPLQTRAARPLQGRRVACRFTGTNGSDGHRNQAFRFAVDAGLRDRGSVVDPIAIFLATTFL